MTEPASAEDATIVAYGAREVVEAYRRNAADRAQSQGPATELMLDLSGVGPGGRVLDVAAGTGEQTLLAAARVGPSGRVLAIDVSPGMLEVAAEAARQAGLANVETRVMDAQALDLDPDSFDAAISRMGLMFIPDLAAALAGIHRSLRPGAKLGAMVFSAAERNPQHALPLEIAGRLAGRPSAAGARPGLFALSDPAGLEAAYREAGFGDVVIRAVPAPRRFPSAAVAIDALRQRLPPLQALLTELDGEQRAAAWAEIERALQRFDGPNGFEAPGEVLVAVGTK